MNVPATLRKVAGTSFIEAFLRSKYPFLIELQREQLPLYIPVEYFALSDSSGAYYELREALAVGSSST